MKNIKVSKSLNCKISKSINPTLKNLNNINRFRFIVLLLITSTFCTFPVNGQWVKVGYNHQGISESIAGNVSLAFSNEGIPFVAFTDDYLNAGNLAVMKFNGSSWVKVGYNHQGISEGIVNNVSLAFDNGGTPFVAFTDDYLNAGNLAVMKFNGSSWVKVGYNHQGISESIAGNVSIAFSNEGNPFVAFTDDYLNAGNLAVKKFNYNYLDLRWRLQAMFPVPDTLSVQLRNSIYPYEVVDSAKVFAELSSTNFRKTIRFKNIITGNSYYIVAKHRTSIETWSAYPVEFLSDTTFYNFTTSLNKAYGNNMISINGIASFYSGDVNQDHTIDAGDVSIVDNASAIGLSGNVPEDLNGDGFVDASDLSIVDENAYNVISAVTP